MESKLELDVYCTWHESPPIYRLFVDDELFAERTFHWQSVSHYIHENMLCLLESGVHILKLETDKAADMFELKNFKVNGNTVQQNFLKSTDKGYTWNFVLDRISQSQNTTTASGEVLELRHKDRPIKKTYETYLPLIQKSRLLNKKINIKT
jgi:hypothetical protein